MSAVKEAGAAANDVGFNTMPDATIKTMKEMDQMLDKFERVTKKLTGESKPSPLQNAGAAMIRSASQTTIRRAASSSTLPASPKEAKDYSYQFGSLCKPHPHATIKFQPGHSGLAVDGPQVVWSSGQAWMKGARPGWSIKTLGDTEVTQDNEDEVEMLLQKAESGTNPYQIVFNKGRNKYGCGATQVSKLDLEKEENAKRLYKAFRFQGNIGRTEHRGITYTQLERVVGYAEQHCHAWKDQAPPELSVFSGKTLNMHFFNFNHAHAWILSPATERQKCSFVELLSSRKQVPEFCICHWWGTPLVDFLKCSKAHYAARGMTADKACYWISAFALKPNVEPDQDEISSDKTSTYFHKALAAADFCVLLMVDSHGVVFDRAWCAYEMSMCLGRTGSPTVDMVVCQNSRAHVLTSGLTMPEEEMEAKTNFTGIEVKNAREVDFPLALCAKALGVTVEKTEATDEGDRNRIMNYFAEQEDLDSEPLAEHPLYEEFNQKMRAFYATYLLRRAAVGPEAESDVGRAIWQKIAAALQGDVWMNTLDLNLQGFTTPACQLLYQSFPPNVTDVTLRFKSSFIEDPDLEDLVECLCKHPSMGQGSGERSVMLDFRNCKEVSDEDLPRFDPLKNLGVSIGLDLTEPFSAKGAALIIGKAVTSALQVSLVPDGIELHRYEHRVVPAIPELVKALENEADASKRKAAARALGALGQAAYDALPALEVAEQEDAEPSVKQACARARYRISGS